MTSALKRFGIDCVLDLIEGGEGEEKRGKKGGREDGERRGRGKKS